MQHKPHTYKVLAALMAVPLLVMLGWFLRYQADRWSWRKISDLGDSCSLEGIRARDLQVARYRWLADGCPQPPDGEKYLSQGTVTHFVFNGLIVVSNQNFHGLRLTNETYHGLFGSRLAAPPPWPVTDRDTLVITTAGEILSIAPSGEVRLRERGGIW